MQRTSPTDDYDEALIQFLGRRAKYLPGEAMTGEQEKEAVAEFDRDWFSRHSAALIGVPSG